MFHSCLLLFVLFLTGVILLSVFTVGAHYRALGMYFSLDLLLVLFVGSVRFLSVQLSTANVFKRYECDNSSG